MKKEYLLLFPQIQELYFYVNDPSIHYVYLFYEHRAKIKSILPFFFNFGGK